MNNANQILRHDLAILEEMAAEMGEYLMSESLYWAMVKGDMPRLTAGGFLMRQHRLMVLRNQFESEEQARLDRALEQFDKVLADQVVRFERRVHRELHAFLGEWVGHLRDWMRYKAPDASGYANAVDIRVVITAAVGKMQDPPYHLDRLVLDELATLDRKLQNRWQKGKFVWATVWRPAYPAETFWWLHGTPL